MKFRNFCTAVFSTENQLDQLMADKTYLSDTHNEAVKFLDGYCLVNIASPSYYVHIPFEKRYPWPRFLLRLGLKIIINNIEFTKACRVYSCVSCSVTLFSSLIELNLIIELKFSPRPNLPLHGKISFSINFQFCQDSNFSRLNVKVIIRWFILYNFGFMK